MTETPQLHRPNALRQFVKAALLRAVPRSRLIASLPPDDRSVALTFDDGPHPVWTPHILDTLAACGARATFFVIGEKAARHPDVIRRIAAEGHAVGHHSWSHSEPSTTSARALLEESRRTRALLEEITGLKAPLFRPPHGKLTASKLFGIWWQQNTVVLWSKDPKDFASPDADALVSWVREHPLVGGDIVLLHDPHQQTAEALPRILAGTRLRCEALRAAG